MTATIANRGTIVDAIDVYCGFGGSGQGITKAGAELKAAANHDKLSIECHSANFPKTSHYRADLVDPDSADYMDPADLPAARFAWFSPGCTHHSPANAKKLYLVGRQSTLFDQTDDFDYAAYAKSERSRVTMSCVLRYADRHHPEIIVTENVVEVCHWGAGRDGSTFAWWKLSLENLGYEVECCFFNSQFFPPCPQSRDRIYIVAWRKGNQRPDLDYRPAAYCTSDLCGGKHVDAIQSWKPQTNRWPLPRWGKYRTQYVYRCPDCRAEVEPAAWPAYTAIDWSSLGPTLAERATFGLDPLADKTVARIRRAQTKFRNCPPIVIPAKSVWGVDRTVLNSFTTQTTQQDKALVSSSLVSQRFNSNPVSIHGHVPTLTTQQSDITIASVSLAAAGNTYEAGTYTRAKHISSPLYTQHTTQAFGFASMPSLVEMRGGGSIKAGQHPITRAAHTVTAGGNHHGLVSPSLFHERSNASNNLTLPYFEFFQKNPDLFTRQLATMMAALRNAAASNSQDAPPEPISYDELMRTHFRMLQPDPELRRVMAFEDDYILLGNKTEMTSGLGNAVTPPPATWITERCLATLRGSDISAHYQAA